MLSIEKAFSKANKTYEKSALVQNMMASKLLREIELNNKTHSSPNNAIWEIGCGTGILTKKLLHLPIIKKIPSPTFRITDISSKMLQECKQMVNASFSETLSVDFILENAEEIILPDTFSLITSNCTFHWFQNLKNTLSNLITSLREGGDLFFSVLGDQSFCEWRSACESLGIEFVGYPLINKENLQEILTEFSLPFSITTEKIPISYSSATSFFRSFKDTGANYTNKSLSPKNFRKLIKKLDRSKQTNLFISTYYAHFIHIKKI